MRTSIEFNGVKYPVFDYAEFKDHVSYYTDLDGIQKSYQDQMLHLEGEFDLPLHLPFEVARGIANHCAECCGYFAWWDDEKRTIDCHGDSGNFRVTYGDEGIINVEDITVESKIKALEGWNETWQNRIDNIESGFMTEKNYGGTPIAEYHRMVDENNAKIAKLKERLNAV